MPEPTWETDISALFSSPYWIPSADRTDISKKWQRRMAPYLVDIHDIKSIREYAEPVYYRLAGRSMPLPVKLGEKEYFPAEACELIRVWINEGMRKTRADPIEPREPQIPPQGDIPVIKRVRKDIRSLTQEELDDYRSRLDDILRIGNESHESPWQKLGRLHADWCLHYQEAFLPWHRANLLYVESLINCAIPYWNWFAHDVDVIGSGSDGFPQPFLDETYIHPKTGETRPNPLRFACARDGISKAKLFPNSGPWGDLKYVQRFPFLTNKDPTSPEYHKHVGTLMNIFKQQTATALNFSTFSVPQGQWQPPWANLPSFDTLPQPSNPYIYRSVNFDGLYEEAHDNYHGWCGPDMADNAYTAFDPVFYSLHANIDRVFEKYLRRHPVQQFTSSKPLQPFAGAYAGGVAMGDPRQYVYTTLGDMTKPCMALGYMYGLPVAHDADRSGEYLHNVTDAIKGGQTWGVGNGDIKAAKSTQSVGLRGFRMSNEMSVESGFSNSSGSDSAVESTPVVVFDSVKCNDETFIVDVFIGAADCSIEAMVDNSSYFGRMTLLGMGDGQDRRRCIKQGVHRVLFPQKSWVSEAPREELVLKTVVTEYRTGNMLSDGDCVKVNGVVARIFWGTAV